MAKKENTFLLLSLEEEKAKKLATVISNEVCRRLLDCLAKKEATETELSRELNIPISTIHYNLKQLLESGLVKADEFHYSEKGKEVNHYSIANKYIIIAPKTTESLANKLKSILPVFAIVSVAGIIIQLTTSSMQSTVVEEAKAPIIYSALLNDSAKYVYVQPDIALWFAIGALFALVVYLSYDILKERLK